MELVRSVDAMVTRVKRKRKGRTSPFPFLDLPAEIRKKVYDILEDVVDHSSDKDQHKRNEYDGFAKTRKALRLTCKTVNDEFTPHFFRSTTFCMRFEKHTPGEFVAFVKCLAPEKVFNIRHLEYRALEFPYSSRSLSSLIPKGFLMFRHNDAHSGRVLLAECWRNMDVRALNEIFQQVTNILPPRPDDMDMDEEECWTERVIQQCERPWLHLETLNIVHSPFNRFEWALQGSDHGGPRPFRLLDWWNIGLPDRKVGLWALWEGGLLRLGMLGRPVRREICPGTFGFRLFFRKDKKMLEEELGAALGCRRVKSPEDTMIDPPSCAVELQRRSESDSGLSISA
ncbi:hypothetical protein EDD36DRAFT_422045 [Exophiala viscosa]|uniref:F-box domain-containing protein n=1 Tax=Exophiala viscosa TaxID=2486360 RepID=A0AAN6DQ43_9EURO|nr:hypothetical protein EDD36DRAFT_422045 [Exophiala viscosa]